jgi:hypothetical protein
LLKTIERTVTKHLDLHLIVDNYTTHKTKEAQAWLAKHPRFKLHFTPTSSSWLNLVERFFAEITGKRIRRGIFQSVAESWTISPNTMPNPNPSSGQRLPMSSSQKLHRADSLHPHQSSQRKIPGVAGNACSSASLVAASSNSRRWVLCHLSGATL